MISSPPKTKKWYKKQEDALAPENSRGEILVKWGNYHFTTFFAQDEFVEFIEETPENDRHFYEVLSEGRGQRMFADLDGEGLSINSTQLLVSWQELMIKIFAHMRLIYDKQKVRILKSRGEKISFHWSYLESFKNSDDQKLFWKYVEHVIENEHPDLCFLRTRADGKMELMNVLDISVYSKNRAFRTYWSTKEGSDRVLEPIKFRNGEFKPIKNFNPFDYLILDVEATTFLNLKIPAFTKLKNKYLTQDDIQKIIKEHVPNTVIGDISGRMFKLKNDGTRTCIINGEENTGDNSYVIWRRSGLYFGCHDSACEGQLKQIAQFDNVCSSKTNWDSLKKQAKEADTDESVQQATSDVFQYMNSLYTAVLEGSRVIVVYNKKKQDCDTNDITGETENQVIMMTKDSLRDILASKCLTTGLFDADKKKYVVINAFEVWWRSFWRREREGIIFQPYPEGESPPKSAKNGYNLWDGYAVQRKHCTKVSTATLENSPTLQHLFKRWCLGDEKVYKFLMGWIASTIQKPHVKLHSAVVVKGKEGALKGQIMEMIGKIIGEKYFFQPSSSEEILGGYNSSMSGKKIIFLDECVWGGDKAKAGILKKLITEERYTVKTKFLPDYVLKNVMNLIMASNEEWCVPAGTHARRYLVLDLLNELSGIGNKTEQIIKTIVDEINSKDGLLSLAKTLYTWDLSDFNDRRPPQTDGLRTQKIHTFSPCQRFIYNALNEGAIGETPFDSYVKKSDLFDAFKNDTRDKHMAQKIFWNNVAEMIGGDFTKTLPRKINGVSMRCIKLPSIEDARNAFRRYIGDDDWAFDEIVCGTNSDDSDDE